MEYLSEMIRPLTWAGIGTAILCGGAIGLERQLRGKAAGMRTSILICLGTQVFIELAASFPSDHVDPTRVLGQVVTGIGFLGAGVILAQGGVVTGVTTAAVVWVLAAIGSVSGLGHYGAAMLLALFTLGVLLGIEFLENTFRRLRRGVNVGAPDRKGDGS
ncbi:MAG: MgtC/SapB family protein [Candidatus Eisenbacteria bacterium]